MKKSVSILRSQDKQVCKKMYFVSDSIAFGGIPERKQIENPEEWYIINVSSVNLDSYKSDERVPLNDGAYDGGNKKEAFEEAVEKIRTAIVSKRQVFVHCAVGQSRSVSTLATALAAERGDNYVETQNELMKIRGSYTEPADSLQAKAKNYLQEEN